MNGKHIETSESRRDLFRRFAKDTAPIVAHVAPAETVGDHLLDFDISRRGFMQFCAGVAALMGLPPSMVKAFAEDVCKLKRSVIYMSFQECTGCLESLVNSGPLPGAVASLFPSTVPPEASEIEKLILDWISLDYQETVMAASGVAAEALRERLIEANEGKFVLVVDGSIPAAADGYFVSGGKSGVMRFVKAAQKAEAIVAVGTCASFGGLPRAIDRTGKSPTGAVSIYEIKENWNSKNPADPITAPVITIPGCPPIAEVIAGSLLYYLIVGVPELDDLSRPKVFYGSTVHGRNCDRFSYLQTGKFATSFDDYPDPQDASQRIVSGARQGYCLLERGCKGPVAHNACTTVKWNQGIGYPMKSGHGCIACSEPHFWDGYYPRVWSNTANRPVAQNLTWDAVKNPAGFGFKPAGFYDELVDPTS